MATIKIKDSDLTDRYYDVIGSGTASEPYQSVVPDYRIPHAINNILSKYGDTVSVKEKAKDLIKFGRNSLLAAGITETVWEVGGIEVYPTGNNIDIVVSTDAADTQEVIIEGHTLSGTDFTFVTQTATLTGVTPVTLTTPLARANRMYNNGSTDFAGTVTVEDNGTSVHLSATGNTNQSLKAATTISSVDYYIITGVDFSVNRSNTAVVDFEFQVREYGKVFRTIYYCSSDNGSDFFEFSQPIIVPPNSDVRVQATSNAASTSAGASIHGYLAIIT